MNTGALLFNQIFNESPAKTDEVKKGRSIDLVAARNEELLHRYIYYGMYSDKRNDAVLEQLVTEYHLTTRTIFNIVSDNFDKLKELRQTAPSISDLRKKYPHKVW